MLQGGLKNILYKNVLKKIIFYVIMFNDRIDAAKQLAEKLQKIEIKNGVVLAVPRGGVPVGYEIAKALNLPLEIFLSKKIGHPHNPEFAIGSVTLLGATINNNVMDINETYILQQTKKIYAELQERFKKFMGNQKSIDLKGKTVILVDDGVATGSTLISAIGAIRKSGPEKIIVAVPVSPPETAKKIKQIADDLICLITPNDFLGVGQFYYNFSQVEDTEVIEILKEASNNYQKNV